MSEDKPRAAVPSASEAADLTALVERLLARSLVVWRVVGRVTCDPATGVVVVAVLGRAVRIERAADDLPFRWTVTVDGRQRPAVSVLAVLRQVRLAVDPGYAKVRVRIAPVQL